MDINWTYWKLTEDDGTGLKSVLGVCDVRGQTVQCDVYNYPDEITLKAEVEKVVRWALDNEERIKTHILEQHYFDIIYACSLYNDGEISAEGGDELRAMAENGQDIGVQPTASEENMERHLKIGSITLDTEYEGFSVVFAAEGELGDATGGHGPSVNINQDFSFGEFDWSG